MNISSAKIDNVRVEIVSLNTVVVGSGAAGFNTALRLSQHGIKDVAIVTEGVNMGTSRNTGSDKQTYYKLTLCGDTPDSPTDMARDLFDGQCMDGDIALVEASLSARCFMNLSELGVPFPTNRYGEYVGYKTDHDPRARATSAGPLTSKLMTEALQRHAKAQNIQIFDGLMAISIIKKDDYAVGLLALNTDKTADENKRFVLFNCKNIVYATGGPAGIYADSVYPLGHSGSSGIAFEAGVRGKNLTEWQYGLASVKPRWNVSGTYMQVLPRFVSVDKNGNEYEFLNEFFKTESECLSMVFLKGYEWPFDSRKVMEGSSVIDLLVYCETALRGRRVFLDFTKNPFGKPGLDYSVLKEDARTYLEKAGACFGKPIDRLLHMNAPAIDLYKEKGVDLTKEMLEIALCAQHNNGGLAVDMWWQTNISGFFAVGEVAGTHGVYRPGGSALNSGQVGSLRAAQYISEHRNGEPLDIESFIDFANPYVLQNIKRCRNLLSRQDNVAKKLSDMTKMMSEKCGAIRSTEQVKSALSETRQALEDYDKNSGISSASALSTAYRLRDILICQFVYQFAMKDYIEKGGKSRGSAIYRDENGIMRDGLDEIFRMLPDDHMLDGMIQEIELKDGECTAEWRRVRPLPEAGGFFENVWREYRENKNIY